MRISLLVALLALLSFSSVAQPSPNLIPNGSFENYYTCPTAFGHVTGYCKNWRTYTAGSSDFFSACNGGNFAGVPNNQVGTQAAADGVSYSGIITYLSYRNYREYLKTDITPMEPGKRYEVSLSISLADYVPYATDGIAMFFYDEFYDTVGVLYPLDFLITPQVTFTSYGVDTNRTGWLRMTATYIPDSAYDNIIIGNFNNNSNTTILHLTPAAGEAYYYIDSVVIKRNPYIKYTFNDTLLCAGDTINIPYTVDPGYFNPSNVFRLELSNATGSFSSPTVIGTVSSPFAGTIRGIIPLSITPGTGYRLRMTGSSPNEVSLNNGKNITIRSLPTVSGSSNSPICEKSTLNLTAASVTGATYAWTGPNGYSTTSQNPSISSAQVFHTGLYRVRAIFNGCASLPDTVDVVVNKPSTIGAYASPDDTICQGGTAQFVAFPNNPGIIPYYQWYKNFVPIPGANALIYSSSSLVTGDKIHCQMTATGICTLPVVVTTDTFEMVVLPIVTKPSVKITATPGLHVRPADTVRFTANVLHGGTTPKYQWYKNGAVLNGASYATVTLSGLSYMDMIHVDIISEDPCAKNKNTSDTVWMQFPVSVAGKVQNNIMLYPNPNTGTFSVGNIPSGEVSFEISDAIGRVVFKHTAHAIDNAIEINTGLAAGVYVLKLTAGDKKETLRFKVVR